MPGGGYTGDGSVKWFVEVDSARDGETKINPRPGFPKGSKHEGIEHATQQGGDFEISIDVPMNITTRPNAQSEFVKGLRDAANRAETSSPGTRVSFKVPIQDTGSGYPAQPSDYYQIKINWPA